MSEAFYPEEAFITRAVADFFESRGFTLTQEAPTSLIAVHPETGERWEVEMKGKVTQVALDTQLGLGRLLQRVTPPPAHHGLAVPYMTQFVRQCTLVPGWVRVALQLSWLLVRNDGTVRIVAPDEDI
jgi:hypothetical protein